MRFLHISDLHLGKRLYEFSLAEDQRYILEQVIRAAEEKAPDGVLIAGDIYDKSVPSQEAVQLLDYFLTELADRKIPVFAVSGNHDSAERLAFGCRLMDQRGVYFSPVYDGSLRKICLSDRFGEVCLYLMPFLKPASVRHVLKQEIDTYQEAVTAVLMRETIDRSKRNILLAHQFVTGAARCESEEMAVGGLEQIDVTCFKEFDYVALGHIHSPQYVGREEVRYCGTPLKYSFSEANQKKSVTLVELEEKGSVTISSIPLIPLRDMHCLRGTYEEISNLSLQGKNREDYMQIVLTDEEDVPDGLQKLRLIYPNLMHLEYDNRRMRENQRIEGSIGTEKKSEWELFARFYELQNNRPMREEQEQFVKTMIRKILEEE